MTIVEGEFNAKVRAENIFKFIFGNNSLQERSNEVKVAKFSMSKM
jgi:hypothetical protein